MSGEGKLVCVTGASGYIASWLVKFLLLRGYSVNATVRNLDDPKKVDHLVALEGAKERLWLFGAELTEEGSFDSAIDGCVGVFHTASPCLLSYEDPEVSSISTYISNDHFSMSILVQISCTLALYILHEWMHRELIDPAVQGTMNVLSSCAKASSIKRVVLTSSISSMLCNGRPITLDTVVDETWFSDPDYCREQQKWYSLSKISAEEAACKYAKENGAETYHDLTHGWVNVKDVADAHILAFEIESASGRYCFAEREVHFSEIVSIMREACPDLPLPNKCVSGNPFLPECKFSRQRAESLGIEFIPIEVTLKEMIQCFKEKQFIKI